MLLNNIAKSHKLNIIYSLRIFSKISLCRNQASIMKSRAIPCTNQLASVQIANGCQWNKSNFRAVQALGMAKSKPCHPPQEWCGGMPPEPKSQLGIMGIMIYKVYCIFFTNNDCVLHDKRTIFLKSSFKDLEDKLFTVVDQLLHLLKFSKSWTTKYLSGGNKLKTH